MSVTSCYCSVQKPFNFLFAFISESQKSSQFLRFALLNPHEPLWIFTKYTYFKRRYLNVYFQLKPKLRFKKQRKLSFSVLHNLTFVQDKSMDFRKLLVSEAKIPIFYFDTSRHNTWWTFKERKPPNLSTLS